LFSSRPRLARQEDTGSQIRGVLTLASRLYRFRPKFRTQAASVLADMAVGGRSGEWRRAVNACGDDTEELMEAVKLVAERADAEHVVDSLVKLRQKTPDTCELWTRRLQFVEDYPLEKRTSYTIGPSFDVSEEFLREQGETVALQYIDKLVTIGNNAEEPVGNRAAALEAAYDVIDLLSDSEKTQVFERVRPLLEQPIKVSDKDRFEAGTQHPLSRFQINFGNASDVQESASWLLARAATNPEECSLVIEFALNGIRSGDKALADAGSSLLTLQNLASDRVQLGELAKHKNPSVRCKAVWMPVMQATPDINIFEELASDPDRIVRLAVVQAISSVHSMDPDAYDHLRENLKADPSAFVRASASTLPRGRSRFSKEERD
ncbi:MAG: HEAT repeat domain-containing protein, partial [Dehalococcoidia bacterium]|nr:HEAT repeat domain-containing protein [Dehalococcoidia bacterium]